ncbi:MAG: hypothetical protein HY097_10250 [Nitrospinae bacterium]|nr:hypothetical protein [Nitrospinota bacterium]
MRKELFIFVLSVILFTGQPAFADDNTAYKNKRQREVLSVSYTMFFNNHRFDEMSVYLSTIQKDREGSLKVYGIAAMLAKHLAGDGWFRTPAKYQQNFVKDKANISIIQRKEGIQVIISRDGIVVGKVFDFNQESEFIVIDVFCKLFGSAA